MRNLTYKLSVPLVYLIIVIGSSTLSSARADCTYIFHPDTDPELVCDSSPVYYTVIDEPDGVSTPDWCTYPEGAGAYARFDPNVPHAPITGWYVVPPGVSVDPSSLPSGFYPFRTWVYNNPQAGCGVSWFG